ncbi:ADP-ribosyl cyclase/cyclic ADP-ribose hydrolase 1-like [Pholidichthys leucotaenia]
MEYVDTRPRVKRRRRCCIIASVIGAIFAIIILAIILGVTLRRNVSLLRPTFFERCEKLKEYDCQKLWDAFERGHVKRDPCNVPMEAYDPLIAAAPFKPACNRMMFWSKTKEVATEFAESKDCYVTMESTALGSILDGLIWCGNDGTDDTFITGCPEWNDCVNNSVRSFWRRASAAFADAACGNVTVMLSGSSSTPFSPESIFGSIELKRFSSPKVKDLKVILVRPKNAVSNCTNPTLNDLQKELDKGIRYICKDVTESAIQDCRFNLKKQCGECW